MYKFEISADSPKELKEKMIDFANELLSENEVVGKSEYIDENPEIAPNFVEPYVGNTAKLTTTAVAPMPQASSSTTSQMLDSRGVPYDARIHASSKTFVKDGSWRYRKGVDDATIERIEAELKGNIVAQPVVIPAVPATTVHVEIPKFNPDTKIVENEKGERFYPPLSATVNPAAVPSQPAPVSYENIQVPQDTRPVHSFETFKNNLMLVLAELIKAGKIDQKYIEELKAYFQVKEIWNILADNLKCVELFNTFVKVGLITEVK